MKVLQVFQFSEQEDNKFTCLIENKKGRFRVDIDNIEDSDDWCSYELNEIPLQFRRLLTPFKITLEY